MSDPVTEVSDIADATARKLQNLRVNATNADAGMLAILPDTPIETGKALMRARRLDIWQSPRMHIQPYCT